MSARLRSVVSMAAATIVLILAGGVSPEPAAAAIGDIISTLNLKQAGGTTDLCPPVNITGIGNNITGTSLAIVRGGALGVPQLVQYRVLLVTSCLGASG